MVDSAKRAEDSGMEFRCSKAPQVVIAKQRFRYAVLYTDMMFTHATSRTPEETKNSDGFDPAFSREICYNGDEDPLHEHWCDRMIFAAQWSEGKEPLSKIAQIQGFGTDRLEEGGHQYAYIFRAPKGTVVRSTGGGFDGEVCFPEPIPYEWIIAIYRVIQPIDNQKLGNKGRGYEKINP